MLAEIINRKVKENLMDKVNKKSLESLGINCLENNQVIPKCRMGFSDKTCEKRSKAEKRISPLSFTYSK